MMRLDFRPTAIFVLAIGTLALSACGKSDKVEATNESAESVNAKVAQSDVRPAPGRWESSMKMISMDIPGMPPQAKKMMQGRLGKEIKTISCLTEEEASKSEKDFFKPPKANGCIYNNFSMGGGKIAADMTCKDKNGSQNMKMAGTYGTEAYAMKVGTEGNMGGQQVSMEMEVSSKRVGDCDGSEKG